MPSPPPGAYAQHIQMHIHNRLKKNDIHVADAQLDWGKFYKGSNKDDEISPEDVHKIVIIPAGVEDVNSCGRESASSGTVGSYRLYDYNSSTKTSTKICQVCWYCPWSGSNDFQIKEWDPDTSDYSVSHDPCSKEGAIGNMNIYIR